jgi:hypothetical protein
MADGSGNKMWGVLVEKHKQSLWAHTKLSHLEEWHLNRSGQSLTTQDLHLILQPHYNYSI